MKALIAFIIILVIYIVSVIVMTHVSRKTIRSNIDTITDTCNAALNKALEHMGICEKYCERCMSPYSQDGLVDTDACRITIGLISGYNYNNDEKVTELVEKLHNFPAVLSRITTEVERETGCYISFNIRTVTTLYKSEWGCPEGGETCYEISAIRNPVFYSVEKSTDWVKSCILIADELKKEYEQSSVTGEIYRTNILYIKNQENAGRIFCHGVDPTTEILTTIYDKQSTKTVKDVIKKSLNK